MKEVLVDAGVPTARFGAFGPHHVEEALAFLETLPGLYVIKTDGLAAGKGVVVTESLAEARDAVRDVPQRRGVRRRRAPLRHRGGPDRSRAVGVRGVRRHPCGAVRLGPGLQADRRRRRRAEHRWDGRDHARAGRGPDVVVAGARPGRRPHAGRACRRGASTTGASSTAGSCSRPMGPRSSSTTSASATPRPRSCSPAARRPGRPAGPGGRRGAGRRADVRRRVGGLRRARPPRATRVAADRRRDRGPRRAAEPPTGSPCSAPAWRADDQGRLVTAGGRVLNVVGRGPDLAAARATGLRRRRLHLAGRACSTAPTSASRPPS